MITIHALLAVLVGMGFTHITAPLPTVTAVGLERYASRCFKIAHLPNK